MPSVPHRRCKAAQKLHARIWPRHACCRAAVGQEQAALRRTGSMMDSNTSQRLLHELTDGAVARARQVPRAASSGRSACRRERLDAAVVERRGVLVEAPNRGRGRGRRSGRWVGHSYANARPTTGGASSVVVVARAVHGQMLHGGVLDRLLLAPRASVVRWCLLARVAEAPDGRRHVAVAHRRHRLHLRGLGCLLAAGPRPPRVGQPHGVGVVRHGAHVELLHLGRWASHWLVGVLGLDRNCSHVVAWSELLHRVHNR
mmetsp:Transcript_18068/g.54480  ORF Transcript_18068/g.54480 Transcript_18068/m.54480 type:complete len:258 (-) Transcript_18068:281-1054(-)